MKGTVSPRSVVVVTTSVAGAAGSNGLKQGLAVVIPAHPAGAPAGLYQYRCSAAMVHRSSVAVVDSPLALVCGVVASPGCAVGVAHTHGCTCGPENTGPPLGWLVTTRRSTVI